MAEVGGVTHEVLRAAVMEDVEAIAVFQTACWHEAYYGLVPQPYLDTVGVPARAVRWRQRLLDGTRSVVLAKTGTEIVGVVSSGISDVDDAPRLELKSLYVDRARRGTGLAGRLLQCAVAEQAAHLWVFDGNARAQAFYRKHRFVTDGQRARDPDTGVWMFPMTREAILL